jgi:hypothetical protein
MCFIRVLFRITGIARVDGVIHSTGPIFASGYELWCRHVYHTCAFRMSIMRGKEYTPFKRRVSEVGHCPCSGLTHGYRFYSER